MYLHAHLAEIIGNAVNTQLRLVPDSVEERTLLWCVVGVRDLVSIALILELLGLLERLALNVRHEGLHGQIHDLSGDSEVDDLLPEPTGVNFEDGLRAHLLVFRGGHQAEDIDVRHDHMAEGNVDECCEEERDVGADEVEDEDFLDHCGFVGGFMLVVFEVGQLGRDAGEGACKDGDHDGQDQSGCEGLPNGQVSDTHSG